jgi:hypothetical protein
MAVSAAFYSVILLNSTVAARFPGGVTSYSEECPNASFCTDGTISRVGFMAFDDAMKYMSHLQKLGWVGGEMGLTSEVKGRLVPCEWIELGRIDDRPVAWLRRSEPGEASIPACDLDAKNMRSPISPQDIAEHYEFICRNDRGVETYRERTTGQLQFVSRAWPAKPHQSRWQTWWRRLTRRT